MKTKEILKIVDDLNERAFEVGATGAWAVTAAHGEHWVEYLGIPVWDSQEDERSGTDPCKACKGTGLRAIAKVHAACPICQGAGYTGPLEPLAIFLPRRACEIAREIIKACEPKPDSEYPLPHDKGDTNGKRNQGMEH